ncbi:MAG TPA: serine/threonine-protein kinase [Gemmataceae bacterium]|nr:serine/threonine-protein kinase [Gemmataceae bacterium]
MVDEEHLLDLVVQWEEQRQQGRPLTAEELCPDDPALQQALRQRLRRRECLRALWTAEGQTEPAPVGPPQGPPEVEGFEILGTLGAGGMGVVYKARQTRLGRLVALKVIRAGPYADPQNLSRFRTEAEATARLQHPNIVQVYEVGEHQGRPYLVLEFVGRGNLAEQLDGTPLPPRRAAELVLALARAMAHAHERGVLHRDLKPANVLLAEDGTPKIADFGLAKRLDADRGQTRTGEILGTPSYMAPEQAEGRVRDLGPATDIYALGAILYELLTGRPPFKGASMLDTLEQVRTHEPVAPTALQPTVPGDLETICLKCLQKEATHRYPSAEALARDLQCFLAGEPISARSLTGLERLTRTIRFSGAPATMRPRSFAVLLQSPMPTLIQLTLFLLFRNQPAYPVVCISVGIVVIALIVPRFFWMSWALLRTAPRIYRRFVMSLICSRFAGWLLVVAIVALARPGHDLAEFYLVFPMWIILDGSFYFLMGSYVGAAFPVAFLHYAVAVLVTLALPFGPLVCGGLASIGLAFLALYLRTLGE